MNRPSRSQAGFSLIELMLALVILLLVVLLSAELMVESARLVQHSARRALDVRPEIVAETLRSDLRAARGVIGSSDLWTSEPLRLNTGGQVVLWAAEDRYLTRSIGGSERGRPYLDRTTMWRWRTRAPRRVEVEFSVELPGAETYLRLATRPRLQRPSPGYRTVRLLVGMRGAGGSGW